MSKPPVTYRIYCLDTARKIVSGDWLEAADDAEAIAKAEAMDFCTKCEIWDGTRLVASLDQARMQA